MIHFTLPGHYFHLFPAIIPRNIKLKIGSPFKSHTKHTETKLLKIKKIDIQDLSQILWFLTAKFMKVTY